MRTSAHLRRLLSSPNPWPWRIASACRCMSTSDSNVPKAPPPLPPIPFCSHENLAKLKQNSLNLYLKPLYARGWFLTFPIRVDPKRHWYRSSRLVKPFAFISFESACQFLKAMGRTSLIERHDLDLLVLDGLDVELQSFSTLKFDSPAWGLGVTKLDVRIAFLAEQMASKYHAIPSRKVDPKWIQPETVIEIAELSWRHLTMTQPPHPELLADKPPLPLPSVPPDFYSEDPAPPITQQDIAFYMKPLYMRFWEISYRIQKDQEWDAWEEFIIPPKVDVSDDIPGAAVQGDTAPGEKQTTRVMWRLKKTWTFIDFRAAFRFFVDAEDHVRRKNPHSRLRIGISSYNGREGNAYNVFIYLQTQFQPLLYGISLRDIGMAIILEKFSKEYMANMTSPAKVTRHKWNQPETMVDLSQAIVAYQYRDTPAA